MEDDGLNMHNWGYYEPTFKGHLNLQLMSNIVERDAKPFLPGRIPNVMVSPNGAFHPRNCMVPEVPVRNYMDYPRDRWVNQRANFLNVLPANTNYNVMLETRGAHSLQMLQPHDSSKDGRAVKMEEPSVQEEVSPLKKRKSSGALITLKTNKPKKGPSMPQENGNASVKRVKTVNKNMDVVINGIDLDISGIPIPICSCTGIPLQCYRWGSGGWQSACCTTSMSMHPLPMSTKRRGTRIAGRKMSQGAFKKVLEKLAAEGYNFSNPIDLRTHWAKHGTNKFVTIR